MTYYPLGRLPSSTWCSDGNPQSGCRALSNICKPMDFATLRIYKDLQRQANRLAVSHGHSIINVDGRIGPQTVAAVERYAGGQKYGHCDELAAVADEVSKDLRRAADDAGAPQVPDPSSSRPSKPKPDGTIEHPPAATSAGFVGALKSPLGIVAAGVGVLLLWNISDQGKKQRRKSAASWF